MGDALIAASILREQPERRAIACSTRWHPILLSLFGDPIIPYLIPVDLQYTQKSKKHPFDGLLVKKKLSVKAEKVLSIRGDLRDYFVARQLFPHSQVSMSGWLPFFAGHSSLLNLPYKSKYLPIKNRYQSWCKMAGIPYSQVITSYKKNMTNPLNKNCVAIHIGAYWKSRQYPFVIELKTKLIKLGYEVSILSGPFDALPRGLNEKDVSRISDMEIVKEFRKAEFAVTNDSGPMHLAAIIGCKTIAIARISDINQWLPPEGRAVVSPKMPYGFCPDPDYASDVVLDDWPIPDNVIEVLIEWKVN